MTNPLFLNFCKWFSTTGGTGPFTVGNAANPDDAGSHDIPQNCGAVNGNIYKYYAQSLDGTQTEGGRASWSSSGILIRSEILYNSDGTTVAVNFATPPLVDMFPAPSKTLEATFGGGTTMLFQNASAPIGWTRVIGYGDRALRVTDTAPSYGGSYGLASVINTQSQVGNTTLSISQMPSHYHPPVPGFTSYYGDSPANTGTPMVFSGTGGAWATGQTGLQGGSGPHTHSILLSIAYVDFIIASKN